MIYNIANFLQELEPTRYLIRDWKKQNRIRKLTECPKVKFLIYFSFDINMNTNF